ncbi:iron chelate uptake ABC transporter family permease subunit [Phaeobacter sp. QD34_3]|uniref:FecCD family ABC transporter permease n=1 Tax=unclassified Phaeobacter TaxID=2621772 RepID=UPI00237F077A|nr:MULTISPECIES: iron chelate uptake ABC transporter family permease subunit [unclassified Phaeobacter]MDE4132216.1 iron chelate uptake ABC transporter family permease subunit [Phaeobacter sp. QD34_3]MDE4135854.1 iron chelate uptake ABC transporter family permease subunit [Phaeobacter sp. QD34_24]
MIWTLRISSLSLRISRRAAWIGLGLFALLATFSILALNLGSYPLTMAEALRVLTGGGSDLQRLILLENRLPRVVTALGVGMAFGLSGAIFQAMMRNPLASPDVIGFTAGAGFGALSAMVLTEAMILPGAIIGALLAAILVTALAWKNGLSPARLILTGIGASLALSAGTDLLMSRMEIQNAAAMAQWLTGSLNARDWSDAAWVWGGLALLAPMLFWLHLPLQRMAMEDAIAQGLGLALTPLRLALTAVGLLLAALAVSCAGPLPFVAFAAGPIARRMVADGRPALLGAAATGALITLLADTAARLVPVIQLPTGVFTALIGALVLIWLLLAQFRKGQF